MFPLTETPVKFVLAIELSLGTALQNRSDFYLGPVSSDRSGKIHSKRMECIGTGALAYVSDSYPATRTYAPCFKEIGKFPTLQNVWLGTSVENQECVDRIAILRGTPAHIRFVSFKPLIGPVIDANLLGIHWAIVGGESGPGARPMEPWWVEELRESCRQQRVAFFFKQWGGVRKDRTGRTLEGKTWDEYPLGIPIS